MQVAGGYLRHGLNVFLEAGAVTSIETKRRKKNVLIVVLVSGVAICTSEKNTFSAEMG